MIPELSFQESKTSEYLRGVLKELSIQFKYPVAKTGIVADIGTGKGPIVLLRADIDALPIVEPNGQEYRSINEGVMHACGHDAHMAMLLGAAKILKKKENLLKGTVRLMFQPAEEGPAGAVYMIDEGVLQGVDAAFGLHVWPTLPTGVFATKPGTIMAASKFVEITVRGRGGHAAMPDLVVDPVVASAAMITSLQTIISRRTSPLASAVVSITTIHAGEAPNVIPDTVTFGVKIRASTRDQYNTIEGHVKDIVEGVARGHGCTVEIDYKRESQPLYTALINDEGAFQHAKATIESEFSEDSFTLAAQSMAGEDFAFIAERVPSCFIFAGIRNGTAGTGAGLHTREFTIDEEVLYRGAALNAALAIRYLEQNSSDNAEHAEL